MSESDGTLFGIETHSLAEFYLLEALQKDGYYQERKIKRPDLTCCDDDMEKTAMCYVQAILAYVGAETFNGLRPQVQVEENVMSGKSGAYHIIRPDFTMATKSLIYVIDLKTGTSPTKAGDFRQLEIYAAEKIQEFPSVKNVKMIIIRPRTVHEQFKTKIYSRESLSSKALEMERAVRDWNDWGNSPKTFDKCSENQIAMLKDRGYRDCESWCKYVASMIISEIKNKTSLPACLAPENFDYPLCLQVCFSIGKLRKESDNEQ